MAKDVALHFGMEEAATGLMALAMYACSHKLHRFVRIGIVIGADLVMAYLCVRFVG